MMFTEELHEVTDRVATLAASGQVGDQPATDVRRTMHAVGQLVARAQALQALLAAHFTALGAFRADGATDTAAWLRANSHLSGRTAKVMAEAARAANASGPVADAVTSGTLAVEHAAILAGLATAIAGGTSDPAVVAPLLAAAPRETPDQFRQRVRAAELAASADGGNGQAVRQRANSVVREFPGDDGMQVLRAELDPERHTIVRNALDAIVDQHWRTGHPDGSRPTTLELPKLRADALVDMARRSLDGTGASNATSVRRGGEPEVVVHIDHRTLLDGVVRARGTCHLADGTPIPAETARRIACDAGIIPAVLGGPGEPLDVGRARRLASPAQRTALMLRSPTCEFAGCATPAIWCKAHHIDWWEHGGPTDLANLALVCERHHHFVHEGGWALQRDDTAGPTITRRPDGTVFEPTPRASARPPTGTPPGRLRGVRGDTDTATGTGTEGDTGVRDVRGATDTDIAAATDTDTEGDTEGGADGNPDRRGTAVCAA